jgi:hypothetical protein
MGKGEEGIRNPAILRAYGQGRRRRDVHLLPTQKWN